MPTINKVAKVPYTAAEMYDLVNAIEEYPQFLPWCPSTTVLSRKAEEVRACIQIAKGGVQHTFTTVNRLQQNKLIEMRLLEGPFRHLEGNWRFEPVVGGCQVSFDLSFEFSNKFLALTASPILQKIAGSFIDAFTARAGERYADPG